MKLAGRFRKPGTGRIFCSCAGFVRHRTCANCYATGDGAARDSVLAQRWYRNAEALGSEEAAIALALTALSEGDEPPIVSARGGYWVARGVADSPEGDSAAAGDANGDHDEYATWIALLAIDRARLSQPFAQFETGILFWRARGVIRDKALGDAWHRRAAATLSTRAGWTACARAAQVVEARVHASLTEAEKARADLLAAASL